MSKKQKVTVLGDGGWGTTLSILLSKNGMDVCLWSPFFNYAKTLRETRNNKKFLPDIKIPRQINITSDLKSAIDYSSVMIIVIPSKYLRIVLQKMKCLRINSAEKIFLSATKGIEPGSLLRMSEVINQELGRVDLAVLSGPNISFEVAKQMPAASVVASKHKRISCFFQDLLMNDSFRIYTNDDVIGVELGGSLKNIIALACGISDGLGFGSNAKSALLTRGLAEICRIGIAMGARRQTFFGISGLGDLVTTCSSIHSRNRSLGEQIAKGKKIGLILKNMKMVAEGVETTRAAYKLSRRFNIDMPITKEIYKVLFKNKSPKKAVRDLMIRAKKSELH